MLHKYLPSSTRPTFVLQIGRSEEKSVLFGCFKLTVQIAKEAGVLNYIVFQNETLKEMSVKKPTTLEEFEAINGVGKIKLNKYGKRFVECIVEHLQSASNNNNNNNNPVQNNAYNPLKRSQPPPNLIHQDSDNDDDFVDVSDSSNNFVNQKRNTDTVSSNYFGKPNKVPDPPRTGIQPLFPDRNKKPKFGFGPADLSQFALKRQHSQQ